MKKNIYISFIFCCFCIQTTFAQDKLFLRNNTTLLCKIASINEKTVSYRDSVGATQITTIPKESIIMAEYKSGEIYVFGKEETTSTASAKVLNETSTERKARKMQEWKKEEETLGNNIIGLYPAVIPLGRFCVSYERLLANKSIGIKIPFALTYDTKALLSSGSNNAGSTATGAGFITGLDINFYTDIKPRTKYYFGPRVRYGKDAFMELEGLTAQLQNGIMFSGGKNFTNTIGIGMGISKIATIYGTTVSNNLFEKQIYPSFSITWRLGIRL